MTYTLTIQEKRNYLHAVITGRNTAENVLGYLDSLQRECLARGFSKVLIEERLEGPRLDALTVFRIVSTGANRSMGVLDAIAYVDVHAESTTMEYAETMASHRGLPTVVFPTVADAEAWLMQLAR